MITARIPKSPAALLSPFAKPEYMDLVNAFIFSALLKLKTRMLPACLLKISLINPS
jgi:hypothetical protein